jgi:glucan phosphoethanolaminetransferase (alkaline phosphatase superfamily)
MALKGLKGFNWKILITIGLLAGLIQVATGVAMYLAGIYFVSWSIFVSVLVLLLCIVFGTRWYRDSTLKGQITYRQALIIGIVISVSTGIVYAIYNIISISFFYPRFLEDLISLNLASAPASQRTPEFLSAMRERVTANTIALSNLIRLSVIGTILSVFASLILKSEHTP